MLFKIAHLLIEAVYLLCPLLVVGRAVRYRMSNHRWPSLRRIRFTTMLGFTAGVLICVIYSALLHGRMLFSQVMISGYFATSFLFLLQWLDRLLWNISRWTFNLHRYHGPLWWYNLRAMTGLLLRSAFVFCVGLPYVLAVLLTYHPRVGESDNPLTLYNWSFERVQFRATDGVRLAGWWIPARFGASNQTVVLCPGIGADKATQLPMVRRLMPAGYNVLVFDFRDQGESGGQLCSFGDLERNDVLGAMRWLRNTHPQSCKKVVGLGVSTGGAALLAAAADPSPEAQNIDAIAVYGTYDRLDNMTASLSREFVPGPLSWFVQHIGLPLAGCQVGADLPAFAPSSNIKSIWPRPVLVIHGVDDEFIPFEQGQSLYDSALEPKMNFWINRCGHQEAVRNEAAAKLVRQVFDAAQRVI